MFELTIADQFWGKTFQSTFFVQDSEQTYNLQSFFSFFSSLIKEKDILHYKITYIQEKKKNLSTNIKEKKDQKIDETFDELLNRM